MHDLTRQLVTTTAHFLADKLFEFRFLYLVPKACLPEQGLEFAKVLGNS